MSWLLVSTNPKLLNYRFNLNALRRLICTYHQSRSLQRWIFQSAFDISLRSLEVRAGRLWCPERVQSAAALGAQAGFAESHTCRETADLHRLTQVSPFRRLILSSGCVLQMLYSCSGLFPRPARWPSGFNPERSLPSVRAGSPGVAIFEKMYAYARYTSPRMRWCKRVLLGQTATSDSVRFYANYRSPDVQPRDFFQEGAAVSGSNRFFGSKMLLLKNNHGFMVISVV